MENNLEVLKDQSKEEELYELGQWMGRKQAFGLIAGRAAAADVECLRRIRDGKLYRAKGVDWTEFCTQYAGVTRAYADRLIRQLEDFGPNYFHLSQVVRISAETYRQIAPAVSDDGIAFGGETIAISPENSHKIVEAVNALREGAPHARTKSAGRIAVARKRFESGVAELNQIPVGKLSEAEREELARTVGAGLKDLKLLALALK